jgi:glycosyltransferase involved in cell wall biosynthesis
LTVFARSNDVAQLRAVLGSRVRISVANESPYRFGEQSSFLVRILRAEPLLVHFPHYNLPLGFTGRFVVTIHDLFSYRFPSIHSSWVPGTANRMLIANAVRRAAAIITPSKATAEDVARRFPFASARTTAIAEASDERFVANRNPTSEAAWQRYLGIRPPYFFYLGQWKAYKNVPLLIDAFAQLLGRYPGVQLVIAGDDPRHPEIIAAASRLPDGGVVLPGHLPDDAIADLYRSAAAVVVPSLAEGFGLPVLEAMACGTTVVCSDIPVLRELADGVPIFCDPTSADSFAAGMAAALDPTNGDDRRHRGIERARMFSWKSAAEETVRIYERLATGRRLSRRS